VDAQARQKQTLNASSVALYTGEATPAHQPVALVIDSLLECDAQYHCYVTYQLQV